MKRKLYLAHPLEKRKWIREVELKIEEDTEVELLNPFYDIGRDDIYRMDRGEIERSSSDFDYISIVERDLEALHSCNGVIAYIEEEIFSLGTLFETWDALLTGGKPIYVVSPDCLMHPWIRYILNRSKGRGFKSWEDFREFLLGEEQLTQ